MTHSTNTARRRAARRPSTVAAALASAVLTLVTASSSAMSAPLGDVAAGERSTPPTRVRTPGLPLVLDRRRLRQPTPAEVEGLTAGQAAGGVQECIVDFDDDAAVALVGGAKNTFVYLPWWSQACDDSWVRVYPTNMDHFHLMYADPDVTPCENPDNEYATAFLDMARGAQECEPIDPVTEPRSFVHSMYDTDIIAVDRVKSSEPSTQRAFTFERIEVVNAGVRVCFRLPVEGPWEAGEPAEPGDHPAQWCWPSLGAGTWDLSAYTDGAIAVTVTSDGDGSANYAIDDLRLSW